MGAELDELIDGPKNFDVVGSDRKQIAREDLLTPRSTESPETPYLSREEAYAALGRRGLRPFDAHIPVPEHRSTQPGRAAHALDVPWRAQ
jgi:hypothetical protein